MGLFFRRPVPPILILCGPVGAAKTALMNKLLRLRQVARSRLLVNVAGFLPDGDSGISDVIVFHDFAETRDVKCCNWAIDEAGIVLNSRESSSLPEWARNKLLERRKDDIWELMMTVQSVSDVDVCFRRFARQGGEIWTPRLLRLPFIGWIWSDTVRAPLPCPWNCAPDCTTLPGGEGDRVSWFHRLLGFGTVYVFEAWDICDLIKAENGKVSLATGDEEDTLPAPIGWDWYFWSQRQVALFKSHAKVSDVAGGFDDERRAGKSPKRRRVSGESLPPSPPRVTVLT